MTARGSWVCSGFAMHLATRLMAEITGDTKEPRADRALAPVQLLLHGLMSHQKHILGNLFGSAIGERGQALATKAHHGLPIGAIERLKSDLTMGIRPVHE